MPHRSFTITLPADTAYHQLYGQMLLVTGAIPTDGILPDRVQELVMQADSTNAGTVTVSDNNNANTSGQILNALDFYTRRSMRNTICLQEFYVKGSVNSQKFVVDIDAL